MGLIEKAQGHLNYPLRHLLTKTFKYCKTTFLQTERLLILFYLYHHNKLTNTEVFIGPSHLIFVQFDLGIHVGKSHKHCFAANQPKLCNFLVSLPNML